MKLLRPRFAISTLLVLTAITAIVIAVKTYSARQIAKTKATYDAQKQIVDVVKATYIADLIRSGYRVADDSVRAGGSGEWRTYIALTATAPDGNQDVCYVEVMGFVAHDDSDKPTWMRVLPMRISHRGRKLNDGLLTRLLAALRERSWVYSVDNRCCGGCLSTKTSEFYLATE